MTWRVWYDEFGSPIAKEWRPEYRPRADVIDHKAADNAIQFFGNQEYRPRTYVIDHKGIIRRKGLRNQELDRAVDQLLQELESEKSS